MWRNDSKLGISMLLTPSLCAAYMHFKMGDPFIPAVVMGGVASYLLLSEDEQKTKKN